jgi:hypothetical protein
MRHRGVLAAVVFVFIVAAPGARADPRGQRCAAAKLRATSRYAGAAFDCRIAAARAGTSVDPACMTLPAARLDARFAVLDGGGGCSTTGDAPVIRATVDDYVGRIALGVQAAVDPGGACAAARLRIFRDTAREGLACYIRFARRGTFIDFTCIAAAQAPLFDGLAALDAAGTCSTPIPTIADVFGSWQFLVATGQRIPFTRCGNGVVELGEQCDGGPLCDASCQVNLPRCCAWTVVPGVCTDASDFSCTPEMGIAVAGKVCVPVGAPCPVGALDCTPGTCQALALATVTVCCQAAERSCTESAATDTAALAMALFDCPLDPIGGVGNRKLGHRCGPRGRCVPDDG